VLRVSSIPEEEEKYDLLLQLNKLYKQRLLLVSDL